MKLIIGLGNPGKKYQTTRHNAGFMAIEYFREKNKDKYGFSNWQHDKKFQAEISEGFLSGDKIILAKPQTFMNASGFAVGAIAHFYKLAPLDIIVINDDIDLPFGVIKIQQNISSAGHKGIKSIIEKLGTQDFKRLRFGIGKDSKARQGDTANFVLNNFSLIERIKLNSVKNQISDELNKLINP
jgi:peptidyl-tRNA hydrolase, PTH1 family